jgi:hypothetical protein
MRWTMYERNEKCIQKFGQKLFRELDHLEVLSLRYDDNIKIYVKFLCCRDMEWILLAQDRDQCWASLNTIINLPVPYNRWNLLINKATFTRTSWRWVLFHGIFFFPQFLHVVMSNYIHSGSLFSEAVLFHIKFVAVVHKGTIPTERPPFVGEVSANLCG